MRKSRWDALAILAVALVLTGGMAWAGEPPTAAPAPPPAKAQAPELQPGDACEPDTQGVEELESSPSIPMLDLDLEMDAVCSPPPECFQDRDCNRICGKNNGTCYRVNSCYRQCICNAV
jgi:hypothetical protein